MQQRRTVGLRNANNGEGDQAAEDASVADGLRMDGYAHSDEVFTHKVKILPFCSLHGLLLF